MEPFRKINQSHYRPLTTINDRFVPSFQPRRPLQPPWPPRSEAQKMFGVKKGKMQNRLKRVSPKFQGCTT